MFTYDIEITYLGQFVDEVRVSADNALNACEQVEIAGEYSTSHELTARRIVPHGVKYSNYFGLQVTG